jgi:hypothetical protein
MRSSFILVLVFFCDYLFCQSSSAYIDCNLQPETEPHYGFIRYDLNRFELIGNNPAYQKLYAKFDTLLKTGRNQIRIVHFGGSHIQADIYTHRIRQEMQSFYPGVLGSRGFFFPLKIARTNGPSNLSITYTGEWITGKNTRPDSSLSMGVSGITSALVTDTGSIRVIASYDSLNRYDFNQVRIFCNARSLNDIPLLLHCSSFTITLDTVERYVQYDLSDYEDTLSMVIHRQHTVSPFELYGISLENNDPGVIYNAIGVNGAMLRSYLSCNLFSRQLSVLDPDWVILSIGTNEGNTNNFDEADYRAAYLMMLDSVKKAAPEAAILLTVPNDCYFRKRYINHNTARIREIILEIANTYGYGVWDFYSIMGGLNSAKSWFDEGLMKNDHIHFTKPGYLLKGDLFFYAFLNSWNEVEVTSDE